MVSMLVYKTLINAFLTVYYILVNKRSKVLLWYLQKKIQNKNMAGEAYRI